MATERLLQRIENDFIYHQMNEEQQARCARIRAKSKELALLIADTTPESREQSVALTNLESVMFYPNAAIARNEKEGRSEANGVVTVRA
jgi:hypothetical protein